MAALNPPLSTAVVDVADDLVERYEAAGWTKVQPKRSTSSTSSKSAKK